MNANQNEASNHLDNKPFIQSWEEFAEHFNLDLNLVSAMDGDRNRIAAADNGKMLNDTLFIDDKPHNLKYAKSVVLNQPFAPVVVDVDDTLA